MKKKILALAAIAICGSVAAGGTLAYFNAKVTAHNVITSGEVQIELVEKMSNGAELVPFPENGISGAMPGTSVSKIVSVKNTGESEAWVRVGVDAQINKNPMISAVNELLPLQVADENGNMIDVISYEFVNTDKWIHDTDEETGVDYYYYVEPVAGGEETATLFESVKFAKEMGNEYQNCRISIDVAANAVQTANNPIPDGGDVTDIQGWPENN